MNDASVQLLLSVGLAVAAAIATFVNLRLKADVQTLKVEVERANSALETRIADKLDRFRSEFASSFVPERIATIERASIERRLKDCEERSQKNSERVHDISTEIMKNLTTEIFRVSNKQIELDQRTRDLEHGAEANEHRIASVEDILSAIRRG